MSVRGASAQRVLRADRIVEEQPLAATIEIRRGRLGLPGAEVFDPFSGFRLEVAWAFSSLSGGRRANIRVVTRFSRRGLQTLAPPVLQARDPLDLARVQTVSAAPAQLLLVLPRTEPVRWLTTDSTRRWALPDGQAAADALAAVDLDGLRPYRTGTPASRIYWPALARGAGLIERRLLADGDSRPLIVLDSRVSGSLARPTQPELLDAAVRAAASLVLELARGGGCGLLLPGEERPTSIDRRLVSWPAAYARLALVKGETRSEGPALRPLGTRLGPMIYVAAEPRERWPASVTQGGLTILVVPNQRLTGGRPHGVPEPMAAILEVSGCVGFRLGLRPQTGPVRREASPA
jgi:uncharacterized protein (DUF58 family)